MLYLLAEQNLKDIEVDFENMICHVQKAFIDDSNVVLDNLLMNLKTCCATKNKQVPLFEANFFRDVTSIEALFKTLGYHWNLYDHDLLAFLIEMAKCDMAIKTYHKFVHSVDLSAYDLVNHCSDKKMAPGYKTLRIKLKRTECTIKTVEKVKAMIVQYYELEKHAILFKNVTKGCFDITYQNSDLVMAHINNNKHLTIDFKNQLIIMGTVVFNGVNIREDAREDAREVCKILIIINVDVHCGVLI